MAKCGLVPPHRPESDVRALKAPHCTIITCGKRLEAAALFRRFRE